MTRDIIDVNDFTVLAEVAESDIESTDACAFDEPVIGVAFYEAGDVELTVRYEGKEQSFQYTKGLALSFYGDEKVVFEHKVAPDKPLQETVN